MKNTVRNFLMVGLTLLLTVSANAQSIEERLKKLEEDIAKVDKLDGDISRVRQEYDKKLQNAADSIKNLKQQQEQLKQQLADFQSKTIANLDKKQKDFEDIYSLAKVPVGTILPYYGSLSGIPKNWRLCDGKPVTDDAQSPFYNQKVPDLQGKFLRGVTNYGSGGFGGGASEGSLGRGGGTDNISSHSHSVYGSVSNIFLPGDKVHSWALTSSPTVAEGWTENKLLLGTASGGGHGHSGGTGSISDAYTGTHEGGDNRPKFYSIYYIIRIK